MADMEDVPPLEDMTDLIKQVDALREVKKQKQQAQQTKTTSVKANKQTTKSTDNQSLVDKKQTDATKTCERSNENKESNSNKQKTNQSSGSTFGGMKKGFLFGGPAKPKTASGSSNKTVHSKGEGPKPVSGSKQDSKLDTGTENIPFIKKSQGSGSENLRMTEVQEAMAKTNEKLMQNKEWVTEDLLGKLQKNEKLVQRLQDPTFVNAIGEFQKNPQEALTKYGDNAEVQEFFKDFCAIMGDHFTNLADKNDRGDTKQSASSSAPPTISTVTPGGADMSVRSSTNPNQATAADEMKMQQILSDPEVRFVLMDPKIQELLETLRNDPSKGERIMQTASGELKEKIQTLVRVGLLQFQG